VGFSAWGIAQVFIDNQNRRIYAYRKGSTDEESSSGGGQNNIPKKGLADCRAGCSLLVLVMLVIDELPTYRALVDAEKKILSSDVSHRGVF
jgi:hypothetical protein